MEDYIFLIIAVVLSIFGAINQNKKRKINDNLFSEKKEESRNHFMDQFVGRDFMNEPEAKKPQSVRANPLPVKVNTETQRGKFYHQVFKSTLPDRPKHELIQSTRKQKEEEVGEVEESIDYLEDFSLRKAFIYSEIMNRKY